MSNMHANYRLAEILVLGTAERTAAALIDGANKAGGIDNIAVVVVEVFED
jgi:serine/threonine protein phosphatase PrpC